MSANSPAARSLQQAAAAYAQGHWEAAKQLCFQVLERHGPEFDALSLLGAIAARTGHAAAALELLSQAAALRPGLAAAHNNHGIALKNLGRHREALESYERALAIEPRSTEGLYNRGNALGALGRHREAVASYDAALALRPRYYEAHIGRGIALQVLDEIPAALASYERAVGIDPKRAEAHNNRGVALERLDRCDEALASYDRALAIDPNHIDALDGRGVLLRRVGCPLEALESHVRVTRIRPDYAGGHLNLAADLAALGRHAEAVSSCARAIALQPDSVAGHLNRGHALAALNRLGDALSSYDTALGLDPRCTGARLGRGNTLLATGSPGAALVEYDRVIAIEPANPDAHGNRGHSLRALKRLDETAASYARALEIDPRMPGLRGLLLHTRMSLCEWDDLETDIAELRARIEGGEPASPPWPVLALIDSPALQLTAAELLIRDDPPHPAPPAASPASVPAPAAAGGGARIAVGYFSADLHDHATAHLIADLIETHDRARFEITAFSFGPDIQDGMRTRLSAAFDRFVPVHDRSDAEIAALSRELGIDIAVDLKGFTADERHRIFAHRAAPLQVSYLGYPGTMAAPYMDYLIADRVLIPERSRGGYAEKIAYLPDSYQPNDRRRALGETPSRAAVGLPDRTFIFCCFNNSYKITPGVFDLWMRILTQVPRSVLWLLESNQTATRNLRLAAERRGVSPDRLVFAPRASITEHLTRLQVADLFLDTHPCNAHTTASDALRAGVPVLTRQGESFAARVAASLLHAVGLPDLVTDTEQEYAMLAVRLATDAAVLAAFRGRLKPRSGSPLFDTPRLARHLEAAYEEMVSRYRRGLTPGDFHVRPISLP